MIDLDLKKKIANLMMSSGLSSDESILYQNISFSSMPQDDFITSAYVRRAKIEADDSPYKYRCFACGKYYNVRNDFVDCFESHVKGFMIGEPPVREPEFEKQYEEELPDSLRAIYKEIKKNEENG